MSVATGENDAERIRGAQHEADLEPRLALLDIDNPLPARADFLGRGLLVQTQGFSALADKSPQIDRYESALAPRFPMSANGDKRDSRRMATWASNHIEQRT